MLKNYLKIALRNLLRQRGYSVINIAGLTIGLAAFLFIALWLQDELSYDRSHEKADRIYRVVRANENGEANFARTAPLFAPALRNNFPEVEHAIRIKRAGTVIRYGKNHFQENLFYYAEPRIFDVFTLPLLQGQSQTALDQPNSVVISEDIATKYFGAENPIGQTLTVGDSSDFKVTGVMKNPPANSHLRIEFLASWATWERFIDPKWLHTWRSGIYYTYVLLRDEYPASELELKFAQLDVHTDYGAEAQLFIHLQPLTDIHFYSHLKHELQANGNILYVYVFSAIALFILLIACINFMNLSTARSSRRMREVGMRKVLGAYRSQLVGQFLAEAIVVCFLGLSLAIGILELGLPYFNAFSGKVLTLNFISSIRLIAVLAGLALLLGVLSGSYPAFFLSSFQPVNVLKGQVAGRRISISKLLRKGLIVFQFTISIALIIGTVVVFHQMQFVKNQDLGFNEEQIVVIPFLWNAQVQNKYVAFKNELMENANVLGVTASGDIPGRMMTAMSYKVAGMTEDESGGITALIVDPDFSETYEIPIVAGRDFSDELRTDVRNTFIINETAAHEMGFASPTEAVGKRFVMNEEGRIIGVIKDFHFNSLHDGIEPLVLAVWPSWFGYASVRIAPDGMTQTLSFIERTWRAFNPNYPFNYFFFDEHFDQLYRADQRFGDVLVMFALLAIFIACLGLFGLVSFAAEQLTKEIGIRKVLGATATNVMTLLSQDFVKLVLVANLIAWPVAYYAMSKWLENFAYRIDIGWWVFALAGGLALVIALLTVSTQAVRAALANPVESLRYE